MTTLTREPGATSAGADARDAILAAGGDARAFERLYRRHVARIHGLARRMLGPGDADDVTQDIFVRAWQKIGLFRGNSAFGTWLYRVGINVILGRRTALAKRRERFVRPAEHMIEDLPAPRASPGLAVDFERVIERLPAGAREVFVLFDVEGYKHQEIARMLGITPGTSKSQLHRARMLLREHLDR